MRTTTLRNVIHRALLAVAVPSVLTLSLAGTASIGFAGTPQDANFSESTFVGGLGQITGLAWATDGSNTLFVTQKTGELRVVRNGTLQSVNVASITVFTGSECGLDAICVDPNYASNKFVYVFATVSSSVQRVLRFTIGTDGGGNLVGNSQTQLGPDLPTKGENHDGSGIAIGPDGNFYFGVGNNGNGNNVGGDGTASEFTSLGSKIGRMTLSGAAVTTNPWYDIADGITAKDYIWAKGLRNPFGLRFHPTTGALWLTAVGDSWEQIFLITAGSDVGWPLENNTSTTNGKLIPKLAYQRNTAPNWTTGGGCITRGIFYNGTVFPTQYQKNLFFNDYNSGKIMRCVMDASGNNISSTSLFLTGSSQLSDISVGPDGALYYSSVGGTIYKLRYVSTAQQNIVLSTTGITVNEGATATFTAKLAAPPAANVTVNTARTSGNSSVTVNPATLTFTPSNWSTPQTLTVSAAKDADTFDNGATITCSSAGLTSQNVVVIARDIDVVSGSPQATITQPTNGATISGKTSEFYGNGAVGTGGTLSKADFYVDGVLKYTDPFDPTVGHFHYGGDHLRFDTTLFANGTHLLRMTVTQTNGLNGSHEVTVTVNNNSATLTHQYTFDAGNFNDSVGTTNGTLNGSASISGGALQLPGGSNGTAYGSLPTSVVSGLTSASFEGWFTESAIANWEKVFFPGNTDTSSFLGLSTSEGTNGRGRSDFLGAGGGQSATGDVAITPGTKYYFACVYDGAGNIQSMYIAPVGGSLGSPLTASMGGKNVSNINFVEFWLGRSPFGGDADFAGSIDEFRIYNGALSASQIAANFAAGPTGGSGGATLTHQYTFDAGNFNDSVGTTNGTLNGSASISGGALQLPGGSNGTAYGSLPTSVVSGLTSASFEGWFTMNSFQTWSKVFFPGALDTSSFLGFTPASSFGGVSRSDFLATGGVQQAVNGPQLSLNTPYFFACVYDAGANQQSLYIGSGSTLQPVATASMGGKNVSQINFQEFWLGRSPFGGDQDFNGSLNEFRVYNGALTASQVSADFTAGPGGGSLPSPWVNADIGSVGVAGSSTYSGGTYTIKGSGSDIWGSADSFQYAYQAASGDCSITARVASQTNTSGYAKAAVMIRSDLTAASPHAMMCVQPSNGIQLIYRTTAGAGAVAVSGGAGTAPYWLRVTRVGNTFTGYKSTDNITWTTVGSTTITMGTNVYIGLPVCSHNNGTLSTATFDNVTATP